MAKRDQTLLQEIERDLLDGKMLSDVLRKVVVLGGRAGSGEMRDWASRELNGYAGTSDPIPAYRHVGAQIRIDGITMTAQITGQTISVSSLPEFAREHIREHVELPFSSGEMEAIVAQGDPGEMVKLSLPMAADLARFMNSQNDELYQTITALYWAISKSSVHGGARQNPHEASRASC